MSYIQQQYRDTVIIPDKHNTGCDESLLTPTITSPGTMQGVYWKLYNSGKTLGIDFANANNANLIGTTIIISNVDFSVIDVKTFGINSVDSDTKIIFNNCKFAHVTLDYAEYLSYELNNCSAEMASISNIIVNNCYFGGTYYDGLRPFYNVTINNSYIADLCHWFVGEEYHSDGVQIYGTSGLDAEDIIFNNCRFEVVSFPTYHGGQASVAYVNACIMVQLEASNGNNIQFNNCMVNGGNYTCYSRAVKSQSLSNALFDGCSFGYSNTQDLFYPFDPNETIITNCVRTNKLYVSSVWKDSKNECHILVTNDTLSDRLLKVRTNNGIKTFSIPHSFTQKIGLEKYAPEENTSFWDYPIDIEYNIGNVDWVVCYDDSIHPENQIRFVNFTGDSIDEIVVDDTCKFYGLYNRYRSLSMTKDANNIVYYLPLWEQSEQTTGTTNHTFNNVLNGHTYRFSGTITYTTDTTTEASSATYIRVRTKNTGCFTLNVIDSEKITLNSGVVTSTFDFSADIVATKNAYSGVLEVIVDNSLPYTFKISNLRIKDITQ